MLNTATKQSPRTFNLRRSSFVGYLGDFDVWCGACSTGGQELRVIHVPTETIRIMPVFYARIMAGRPSGRSEFWRDALAVFDRGQRRGRRARWLVHEGARSILAERAKKAAKGITPEGMVYVKAHLRRRPGMA